MLNTAHYSVQWLSQVQLFVTPWTAACQIPCPSSTPGACSNSCPLSRWCHPTISSSVVPFSCLQSFPASPSFSMSQFFASGGQSIRASSISPTNIQDSFPLELTGLISLLSKGLSIVFSNTTVQKLITSEMQIKTTNLTPVRMTIIKKSTNNKCWRECGDKGILLHSC